MISRLRHMILIVALMMLVSAGSHAKDEVKKPVVYVLDVKGTINPGSSSYIESAMRDANKNNISAVVVKLDTPGGLLSSTRSIVQAFSDSEVPAIFYITPAGASGTSAGAIITIGAHIAAMAPGTNIGAAHPVVGSGKDIQGDMRKKVENDTSAFIRSLAKLRGKNQDVAVDIVTKSHSFTAEEAKDIGIIDLVAPSLEELLEKADKKVVTVNSGLKKLNTAGAVIVNYEMTPGQHFLHIISNPNISYALMALGGLGIYVEITTAGAIFPGVIGAISIILAFVSLQTLPVNYGGVALILLAIILFVLEAFVVSFGALTIGGLASMILGTLFLVDSGWADIGVSPYLLYPSVAGIGVFMIFVGFLVMRRRKEMKNRSTGFEGYEGRIETLKKTPLGKTSGKVAIKGEIWDYVSNSDLEKGDRVVVQKLSGLKLVVNRKDGGK